MAYALDFSLCKFIHQNSERYPPPYKQAARFNVGQLLAAAVCIDSILLLFLKKTRELHAFNARLSFSIQYFLST